MNKYLEFDASVLRDKNEDLPSKTTLTKNIQIYSDH